MKQIASIFLGVSDLQNKFYTYTRLYAGYDFDTNQPLDPYLADRISAFLQSYKHDNRETTIETAVGSYLLFSWRIELLSPNILFSEVPHPRIVLSVSAEDAKKQAILTRALMENSSGSKQTLEHWFAEIERDQPNH